MTLKEFAKEKGLRLAVRRNAPQTRGKAAPRWRAVLWSLHAGVSVSYRVSGDSSFVTRSPVSHGISPENAQRALARKLAGNIVILDMQDIFQDEFRVPDDLKS